jgi:hypothetical protein
VSPAAVREQPCRRCQRLTFAVGEELPRRSDERYIVAALIEPENENFRAYIAVRRP